MPCCGARTSYVSPSEIPLARKSGFVRRHGVMRRETVWIALGATQDVIATPTTAILISLLDATGLALRPFTIVRTRGTLFIHSDQRAATEDYELGYAHVVVEDAAAAIGITAVPTPFTDADSDSFYVYEQVFGGITVTTDVGVVDPIGVVRYFDSKAMRRVNQDQQVLSVAETSGTSEGVGMTTGFRILVKLH